MRVASVDIGSNTILLLVVERTEGSIRVLHDECRFGRLSQGLDKAGKLGEQAIERCLGILSDYRRVVDRLKPDTIRCVGTAAVRSATNASVFREPAEGLLGAPIETISGEREAELVHTAVAASMAALPDPLVIADVGGASTEVIVSKGGQLTTLVSLPIGAVRLFERCLPDDPPTPEQRDALRREIDQHLASVDLPKVSAFVGTAGTATTMAAIARELTEYNAELVHDYALPQTAFATLLDGLFSCSLEERKSRPGLEPERADVILAGATIYERLFQHLGAKTMRTGDRGVRWGLAYEQLGPKT